MAENPVNNTVKLRSDDLEDSLLESPGFLLRHGTPIISAIFLMILTIVFLIRYPDKIIARGTILSAKNAILLESRTNGRIKFLRTTNEYVRQGDLLAFIAQNDLSLQSLQVVKSILSSPTASRLESIDSLGPLSEQYERFRSSIEELNALDSSSYIFETRLIQERLSNLNEQLHHKKEQVNLISNELMLQKTDLERDSSLLLSGVLSPKDFEKNKLIFIQLKEKFHFERTSLLSIKEQALILQRELIRFKTTWNEKVSTRKSQVSISAEALKDAIESLEKENFLYAEIDGFINLFDVVSNQIVQKGQTIMGIIPKDINKDNMIATTRIGPDDIKKVEKGQDVIIEIIGYPKYRFGALVGSVKNISLIPNNGEYIVDVQMPSSNKTNLGHDLSISDFTACNLEIIVEELTLGTRFLYKIKERTTL